MISVTVSKLTKRFGGVVALQHLDLSIEPGELFFLLGPSGCGKTTLLRLLNGFLEPDQGSIRVLGNQMTRKTLRRREVRRRTGFIFQDFNLVERATVLENVLWGRLGRVRPWLSLVGRFSEEDREKARAALEKVDLAEYAHRRADRLSGGQQQRVGIARVIAQEADVVLADEPVSNLDPSLAWEILELLGSVCGEQGTTLLMSLHVPALALAHADRVIALQHGRLELDLPSRSLDLEDLEEVYGTEGPPPLATVPRPEARLGR